MAGTIYKYSKSFVWTQTQSEGCHYNTPEVMESIWKMIAVSFQMVFFNDLATIHFCESDALKKKKKHWMENWLHMRGQYF